MYLLEVTVVVMKRSLWIVDLYFQETERSKEAFMDMLAARYPKYAEKISSTTSEDGFPVRVSYL